MLKKNLTATIALPLMATFANAQSLTLNVPIPSNESDLGNLRVGVFTSQEAFDQGTIMRGLQQQALSGDNTISVPNLPAGTYGISVYIDKNGNGELDTNLFGAPSEPYGFTLNPTIGFSAPEFKEFSFSYDGKGSSLTIYLNGI